MPADRPNDPPPSGSSRSSSSGGGAGGGGGGGGNSLHSPCDTVVTKVIHVEAHPSGKIPSYLNSRLSPPPPLQLPKVHAKAITGMDWSFDNSQLLSVGEDGALCIWDTSGGGAGSGGGGRCIRSLALRTPLRCCRFLRLNPNLAIVGTAAGWIEVYNCSAGECGIGCMNGMRCTAAVRVSVELEVWSCKCEYQEVWIELHANLAVYPNLAQGGSGRYYLPATTPAIFSLISLLLPLLSSPLLISLPLPLPLPPQARCTSSARSLAACSGRSCK